jgi:hypothetical protein
LDLTSFWVLALVLAVAGGRCSGGHGIIITPLKRVRRLRANGDCKATVAHLK